MELPPLSLEEAEAIHRIVMAEYPEEPSGVRDRGLLESTLLRPLHAAHYQGADEYSQVATLLWGLVRNHPFIQGNKRTAIAFFCLERAGYHITATEQTILDLVYALEAGTLTVDAVAAWLLSRVETPTAK